MIPVIDGERPLSSSVLSLAATIVAIMFAALWVIIKGLLGLAAAVPAYLLLHFGFVGQLINTWGGTSTMGLQALVAKLQATALSANLAPPQLQDFHHIAGSIAWAAMRWTSECSQPLG